MRISDLYDGFIRDCERKGLRPSTIYGHKIHLRTVIDPAIGEMDLKDLTVVHSSLVIERASSIGASTPNHSIITLRRLLTFAKLSGHKLNFDIADVEVPRYRRTKAVESLSVDEIRTIREFLTVESTNYYGGRRGLRKQQKESYSRTLLLFDLLLHTGLRLSEALSIDRSNISLRDREIRIVNAKSRQWETVYIHGVSSQLEEYLESRKDDNPALFISTAGSRLKYSVAQSMLKRVKKKMNLEKNLNHHIFRKTFVTHLLRKKIDPKQAQMLARHRSLQTTLDYYYSVQYEQLKPIHKRIIGKL